ncbi:MAG TPA: hypothetical protein VN132_06535 [Bdellovibrio sp.]|nr:hypothetical protein [Bdellovibrio sp.]
MKTIFLFISLFSTISMAADLGSLGSLKNAKVILTAQDLQQGVLLRKTSPDQTKEYQLKLKNGLVFQLKDRSAQKGLSAQELETLHKSLLNSQEGGWQPELAQEGDNGTESAMLELVRMSAQKQCSGEFVMTSLASQFGELLQNKALDISSLPEQIKSCLDQ